MFVACTAPATDVPQSLQLLGNSLIPLKSGNGNQVVGTPLKINPQFNGKLSFECGTDNKWTDDLSQRVSMISNDEVVQDNTMHVKIFTMSDDR